MRVTKRSRVAAAILVASVAAAGCGARGTDVVSSGDAAPVAATFADLIPTEVTAALARDELSVRRVEFAANLLGQAEALTAFAKVYDPAMLSPSSTAYPVLIQASRETVLPMGRLTWMLHTPGVKQEVTAPMNPDGSTSNAETILTDRFAFFDPATGDHLATVYIGP